MFLYALLPPGNISAGIIRLKKSLFQNFGFISPRAVPPLIPVKWSLDPPGKDDTEWKNITAIAGQRFLGRAEAVLTVYKEGLFLSAAVSPELRELVLRFQGKDGEGTGYSPFPCYWGFFMGSRQETGEAVPALPDTPGTFSWQKGEAVCFDVQFNSAGAWWENVLFTQFLPD